MISSHLAKRERPLTSMHLISPVDLALNQMPVPFDAVACSKRRQEYLPMNQHAVVFVHMWTTANVHLNDIIVERCDAEFRNTA